MLIENSRSFHRKQNLITKKSQIFVGSKSIVRKSRLGFGLEQSIMRPRPRPNSIFIFFFKRKNNGEPLNIWYREFVSERIDRKIKRVREWKNSGRYVSATQTPLFFCWRPLSSFNAASSPSFPPQSRSFIFFHTFFFGLILIFPHIIFLTELVLGTYTFLFFSFSELLEHVLVIYDYVFSS